MFIYAWTARPEVPWIAPAIGLVVRPGRCIFFTLMGLTFLKIFMTGAFVIYMVVFLYLADWRASFDSPCEMKFISFAVMEHTRPQPLQGRAYVVSPKREISG